MAIAGYRSIGADARGQKRSSNGLGVCIGIQLGVQIEVEVRLSNLYSMHSTGLLARRQICYPLLRSKWSR